MVDLFMHGNEAVRCDNYDTGAGREYDVMAAGFGPADETPCPADVRMVIDACHRLRADALALEMIDYAIVAAVNIYDGTSAVTTCSTDAHLPSIVRGLQVRLYSGPPGESRTACLPAAVVRSAMGRWERQIALVFGRQYAATLITGAVRGKEPEHMTHDGLERIRLQLSFAIGECLILQKVDK
jgi:hypothetical protein